MSLGFDLFDQNERSLDVLFGEEIELDLTLLEAGDLQIGLLLLNSHPKEHVLVDEQREQLINVHEHSDLVQFYLVLGRLGEPVEDLLKQCSIATHCLHSISLLNLIHFFERYSKSYFHSLTKLLFLFL